MKYAISIKGQPFCRLTTYTLRDFCVSFVDAYSIDEEELEQVCRLQVGEVFTNEDLIVTRIA